MVYIGGVKRASKELQSCLGFFSFLFLFVTPPPRSAPFSGLHAEPAGSEEVVAEWETRGVRVQVW